MTSRWLTVVTGWRRVRSAIVVVESMTPASSTNTLSNTRAMDAGNRGSCKRGPGEPRSGRAGNFRAGATENVAVFGVRGDGTGLGPVSEFSPRLAEILPRETAGTKHPPHILAVTTSSKLAPRLQRPS